MRKFLKVTLWVIAAFGILALLAILGFGYFIYREMDKRVISYTCNSFTRDIDSLSDTIEKSDEYTLKMQTVSLITTLMMYTETKNRLLNDISTTQISATNVSQTQVNLLNTVADTIKMQKNAQEIYSLCKAQPDLIPIKYFSKFEKDKYTKNDVVEFENTIKSLNLYDNEFLNFYIKMISEEMQRRIKSAQDIEKLMSKPVSTTHNVK